MIMQYESARLSIAAPIDLIGIATLLHALSIDYLQLETLNLIIQAGSDDHATQQLHDSENLSLILTVIVYFKYLPFSST